MIQEQNISIRAVLSEANKSHSVFSIEYWKTNGEFGSKARCCLVQNNLALNNRKQMNRSGKLKLQNLEDDSIFEIYIDFLIAFNGIEINHQLF
jgi:hypothetical protein